MGLLKFFKMADFFITENLYRPTTAYEEEESSKESNS